MLANGSRENLNELELMNSTMLIVCFIGVQMKCLKVYDSNFVSETKRVDNDQQLNEFLYTQKKLETLKLIFRYLKFDFFAKNENAVYQFKLKQLDICSISIKRGNLGFEDEDIKDFLYTQKDSVEILKLGCKFSNEVYELFLNKFEKIETLSIGRLGFPMDLKRLKVKKNVTKLLIRGVSQDPVEYCNFFSLFPNVTDISFSSNNPFKVLSCLSNLCNALTRLSLCCLLPGNYQNLKFSALKKFHLEYFEDENDDWSDLVMSNQTIESLSFGNMIDDFIYIDVEKMKMVCEALPNLKYLKLGEDLIDDFDILENFKKTIQISLIGPINTNIYNTVYTEDVEPRVIGKSELACQRYRHLRDNFQKENQKCFGPHNLIGGYSAINEFPHMAAIGYDSEKDNTSYVFLCSGSLISEKFVLTAARCLKIRNQFPKIVRLGKVTKAQTFIFKRDY